ADKIVLTPDLYQTELNVLKNGPQIPVMPFYVFRTGIDFYFSDLNVTLQISAALAAENEFYSVNRFQL
ncbi:hypothetical protein Q4R06_15975, partial [Morganella morganii subsp. sibonii]